MLFDVVIGNPPYNNGMDIDFIDTSFKLSKRIVGAITPAKWQTASDDQRIDSKMSYGKFRKDIVPYMVKVVFYPACQDVFNILQVDGVTWYVVDKNKITDGCTVENRCKHIENFNGTTVRDITNRQSLINIGNEIVEFLGDYKKFEFMPVGNSKYAVWTNNKIPGGGLSTLNSSGSSLFVGDSHIEESTDENENRSSACNITFTSDNIDECESFISFMNCKFTRFFVGINISKLSAVLCNDVFRLVPAPVSGKFDHIYTDEELYKEFNLPERYIEVIESVVKDRKKGV